MADKDCPDARMWKALDSIAAKLSTIEDQLSDIVRLEERMNNHESAIVRYGNRLDRHSVRIHEMELWQANHGDKASTEQLITGIRKDNDNLAEKIDVLESTKDIMAGEVKLVRSLLKWIGAIIAAMIIWALTRK